MHPREQIVRDARVDLGRAVAEWMHRHDLTTAEAVMVICSTMSGTINGAMKYEIRYERHGDDQTPGGLEKDEAGSGDHGVPQPDPRHGNGEDHADSRRVQD